MTALLVGSCVWLSAIPSQAQIDRPNNHIHYTVEIEPHLVVQWSNQPAWNSDGIGLGLRASIPVMQDGPVTTINNSLALGFGLDWAHFGDDNCFGPGPNRGPGRSCSANDFWVPLVVQWNFFFSDLISAFPEVGLGIQHTTWDGAYCSRGGNYEYCDNYSNTDVDLVLWLGVRFHLSHAFALTLRLGTPSLLLGASFFL